MAEEVCATERMWRTARRMTLLGASSLAVVGCWRRGGSDADRFGSTAGMRFYAETAVIGADRDTVRVVVSGRNTTTTVRHLVVGGGCGNPGDAIQVIATRGDRRWDSVAWRQQQRDSALALRRAAARRDSTRTVFLGEVCAGGAIAVIVRAGDSARVDAKLIPVAAMLGDSLSPGRYRLRISFGGVTARSIGGAVEGMRRDEVELR